MPIAIHRPTPPTQPFLSEDDPARKIEEGRCWDLKAVQAEVLADSLKFRLSANAQVDLSTKLNWNLAQFKSFFNALSVARYNNSLWCVPPEDGNKYGPMAADSYLMGFDKIRCLENQKRDPYAYIKFTVMENSRQIMVFSCHPTVY